jgi:hypothetical protein
MLLKSELVASWVSQRLEDKEDEAFCLEGMLEAERALQDGSLSLGSVAISADQWVERELLGRAVAAFAADSNKVNLLDVYVAAEWILYFATQRFRGEVPVYLEVRRLAFVLWTIQRPRIVRLLLADAGVDWADVCLVNEDVARGGVDGRLISPVEPFDIRWAAVAREALTALSKGEAPVFTDGWVSERRRRVRATAADFVSSWPLTAMLAVECGDLPDTDHVTQGELSSWSDVERLPEEVWLRGSTLVRQIARNLHQ